MADKAPTLLTPSGRISFPSLDKMRKQPGSTKEYFEISILLSPQDIQTQGYLDMKAAIDAEIAKAYPKGVPANFLYPIMRAEVKRDGTPNTAYAGTFDGYFLMRFKSTKPVGLVGPKRDPATGKFPKLDSSDPDVLYPGMYGRVSFYPYVYMPRPKEGIPTTGTFLTLQNVQKTGDGDRLGGASAEGHFDDVESDAWTGTPEPGMEFLKG